MTGRKAWASDEVLSAADLNGYLMDQAVTIWANATARNSGILAPIKGQLAFLQDVNIYQQYSGTAWGNLTATTVGTASYSALSGTAVYTSGTAVYGVTAGTAYSSDRISNRKVFIQSGTPTAEGSGDLWFW